MDQLVDVLSVGSTIDDEERIYVVVADDLDEIATVVERGSESWQRYREYTLYSGT
jgi:hypothetical protein